MSDLLTEAVAGGASTYRVATEQGVVTVEVGQSDRDGLARVDVVGCDLAGVCFAELTGQVVPSRLGDLGRALRKLGAELADAPSRSRRPARARQSWTAQEEDLLVRRTGEGALPSVVARELGRSLVAVQWRLHDLGLGPRPQTGVLEPTTPVAPAHEPAYRVEDLRRTHPNTHRRWTPEDEQRLRDRFAQGAKIADLVAELGRNEGGITARLIRLGLLQPPPSETDPQR